MRAALTCLLAFIAALATLPSTAWAHPHLTRSNPAAGARLSVAPAAVALWFSEAPELALTRLVLRDSAGRTVALGAGTRDSTGLGIRVPIVESLAAGKYTVTWHAVGADGHAAEGSFTFVVRSSAPPDSAEEVPAAPDVRAPARAPEHRVTGGMSSGASGEAGSVSPGQVAARAALYLALLATVGTMIFCLTILPRVRGLDDTARGETARHAARLGMGASVLLLAADGVRLAQQVHVVDGAAIATQSATAVLLTQTRWGFAWLVQVVAGVISLAFLWRAARGSRAAWFMAAPAVVATCVAQSSGGHAIAVGGMAWLAVGVGTLHLLGAGGWLGSLLCVVAVGVVRARRLPPDARWKTVASLVNGFSPVALACAATIALTGIGNAWFELRSLPALWTSSYGRVLLVKLALLVPLALAGAFNWRRVRPSLGSEAGTARLRRSAWSELAIGALVVLVTAVLVATPTPMPPR